MKDTKTPADWPSNYPGFTESNHRAETPPLSAAPTPPSDRSKPVDRVRSDLGMYLKLVLLILLVGVPLLIGSILYNH